MTDNRVSERAERWLEDARTRGLISSWQPIEGHVGDVLFTIVRVWLPNGIKRDLRDEKAVAQFVQQQKRFWNGSRVR